MSTQNSLRPAWHKGAGGGSGRGFQPPPTASDRGDKARSSSWGSQGSRDGNKFSALLDDDDDVPPPGLGNGKSEEKPSGNSRSEAFRTSFGRGSSSGNKKPSGRSLADLAARVPDNASSGRRSNYEGRSSGTGRFSGLRSGEQAGSSGPSGSIDSYKPDPKVIRYTREKLLSMRPPSNQGPQTLPPNLTHLEGSTILSKTIQDPVCWDNFDGEEIWEQLRARKLAAGEKIAGGSSRNLAESADGRRNASSSGRWARGVALPPSEDGRRKGDADNPNELWDDPVGGAMGAASDFSAFGAMPDDGGGFDFDKMAEASKNLEAELRGGESADENAHSVKVDLSRPLASAGMTLASGSGNNVNVFEDFDDPTENEATTPAVRSGDEDPSASSRLMAMIGVTKDPPADDNQEKQPAASNPWGTGGEGAGLESIMSLGGGAIPLNPWGGPDMFAAEQKARKDQAAAAESQKRAQEAEVLRRRQEDESQRRAMAHRQAEEQARQQQAAAIQQQQQQAVNQQSQVELVLMERICQILENSWGRSDLSSILTTLHSEDSRVIPLLSNVDALRALIARSPQRVALKRDPNFGGDMAVLSMTNNQWQLQQQQHQARLQQEELQRRRMEEEAAARAQTASINPDAPWFYSDPQKNIQGPFRGEEMRQWLEAGYFKGDLPISQQPSGPFVPLSVLFPDAGQAFRAVVNNAAKDEAEAAAAVEEEERRKIAAEEERRTLETAKAEEEARQNAERQRIENERQAAAKAEAAAASNSGNESSNQLKMMLGLSSDSAPAAGNDKVVDGEDKTASNKGQSPAKRPEKANKKPQAKPAKVEAAPEPEKPAKPSAAAWGGAANSKPKKSMSEIQQEEARAAAVQAMQQPRQSSSGWANVAATGATGKSGWSGGAIKQTPAAVVPNVATARQPQVRPKAPAPANAASKAATLTQQHGSNSAASSTPADEFGASMSPVLEKYCKEQMQKINGSDDLTLVAFCMTLNDAHEIRQYLTTYLGSTSQVNNFATEFINKRGLGQKQEEWATPGSAKKGRKKKAGR